MEKAIVTKVEGNTPADMIRMAVTEKADLDKIEKLLTLQERWEANEAKKMYNAAMSEFKANPPEIEKDKKAGYTPKNGGPDVKYNYASLSNITNKINKELSKYGLSASWRTKQEATKITVSCKITHILGHSEETSLSAEADVTGAKNAIQAIGSTITYLEKYTLLAMVGLATRDQDDDGKATIKKINDEQVSSLLDILDNFKDSKEKKKKFYEFMKVEKIEDIKFLDYERAMSALKVAVDKAKKEGDKK